MNAAPRRIWRPLRSFLILISVAGAVLAADKTWLTDLRFDFDPADWWSNISPAETPNADVAIVSEPANHRAPELSMGQLLHGLLFSKPSSGWRLEPEKSDIASAWMTQQSGETFTSLARTDYFQPSFSPANFIASSPPTDPDGGPPPPPGFWIANASGNWSNPANWKDGIIASGATAAAHFDMLDITTDVTVTLDSSRIIGSVYVGDTNGTHRYDIAPGSGGQRLVFDNGTGTALLQQISTSAGDIISVPIALTSDLIINNASTAQPFRISGDITSNRATPTISNLTFEGTVNVSGNITPGSSGGDLRLTISGNVNLSGTNTYGGSTFVTGTLFVKGDNSGATGPVQVAGGGSLLSGIGTIGGQVSIFGGTITGADTTTVGTLTLTQSLSIMTSEGGGGTYLANLDGATSDLLAITGTLSIGNGTTLDIHGTADGTTTYILATFAGGGLSGMFDVVTGLPTDYTLVYTSSDIELVPTAIPEPATWFGGALTLGAIGFAWRSRKAEKLKR
ncbi:MAG: PEP-CTERM sorting domain-containing protein [Chthoniobacterales bacterium]